MEKPYNNVSHPRMLIYNVFILEIWYWLLTPLAEACQHTYFGIFLNILRLEFLALAWLLFIWMLSRKDLKNFEMQDKDKEEKFWGLVLMWSMICLIMLYIFRVSWWSGEAGIAIGIFLTFISYSAYTSLLFSRSGIEAL